MYSSHQRTDRSRRFSSGVAFTILLLAVSVVDSHLHAQEKREPIEVTPFIGDTLSRAERDLYRFIPFLDEFDHAVFFLNTDSTVDARVFLSANSARRDTMLLRYKPLAAIRNQVSQILAHIRSGTLKAEWSWMHRFQTHDTLTVVVVGDTKDSLFYLTGLPGLHSAARNDIGMLGTVGESILRSAGATGSVGDPASTGGFLMPTAISLPAHRGSIAAIIPAGASVSYGITDWWMTDITVIPLGFFNDQIPRLLPGSKITIPIKDRLSFAFCADFLWTSDKEYMMLYSVVLGIHDYAWQLNAGMTYFNDSRKRTGTALYFNGETALSGRVSFLAECIFPTTTRFLNYHVGAMVYSGVRIRYRNAVSDICFMIGEQGSLLIPILKIVVPL